jgi:ribonuclease VapC
LLNIRDPEVHKLAREVADATGETLTEAVRKALQDRLERVQAETEAEPFSRMVANDRQAVLSAANYVEFGMLAQSRRNLSTARIDAVLGDWGVATVPVSLAQARLAVEAFARFGKGRHPAGLNYGDCFAYALAKERGEPLLFMGEDFARTDIARAV